MSLARQSAEALRVPMPVLKVMRDHLLQTIGSEGEEVDWSAIGAPSPGTADFDGALQRAWPKTRQGVT